MITAWIIAETTGIVNTVLGFFARGGLFMWPLLACAIVSVPTRARHEMVRLERGLIVLEVIVGIAPLLGLIGAVSGLVHVFSHLGLSAGASDTRQIALGIAEALNATVFGLSIAVPTLIGF